MTSARVAAAQARRELEFLEIAEVYSDRLEAAKDTVLQAGQDSDVPDELNRALKAEMQKMYGFRSWARTVGRPKDGVPGRDAVIRMGES